MLTCVEKYSNLLTRNTGEYNCESFASSLSELTKSQKHWSIMVLVRPESFAFVKMPLEMMSMLMFKRIVFCHLKV